MNDVGQLGDIWRIHYWKDPDDHDAGIKSFTYMLLGNYMTSIQDDPTGDSQTAYQAIEIETGIDNSLIYASDLSVHTRTHYFQDYIVFAEKLA